MTAKNLDLAKDQDLRTSLTAIRRAAKLARDEAIRTNTHLVIYSNGAMQRISAEQLRQQEAQENGA